MNADVPNFRETLKTTRVILSNEKQFDFKVSEEQVVIKKMTAKLNAKQTCIYKHTITAQDAVPLPCRLSKGLQMFRESFFASTLKDHAVQASLDSMESTK